MKQEYESWFDAEECEKIGFVKVQNLFNDPEKHVWARRINDKVYISYTPHTRIWNAVFANGEDGDWVAYESIRLLIESKVDAYNAVLYFKNLLQ